MLMFCIVYQLQHHVGELAFVGTIEAHERDRLLDLAMPRAVVLELFSQECKLAPVFMGMFSTV